MERPAGPLMQIRQKRVRTRANPRDAIRTRGGWRPPRGHLEVSHQRGAFLSFRVEAADPHVTTAQAGQDTHAHSLPLQKNMSRSADCQSSPLGSGFVRRECAPPSCLRQTRASACKHSRDVTWTGHLS
eukprot:7158952-Alexandrium_andersonii.AAC.3